MLTDFKLPLLGENIKSGVASKIMVKVGDTIKKDQPVLEIETDKAVLEVPSTVNGIVKEILIKSGTEVKVGQIILKIDSSDAAAAISTKTPVEPPKPATPDIVKADKAPANIEPSKAASKPSTISSAIASSKEIPAAPSVRRFAREIGIDVSQVPGSGPGGRISQEDVKAYAKQINKGRAGTAGLAIAHAPLADFSKWGQIERKPMNMVRKKTAEHLSSAWVTIPHVTQFDKADITELEQLRKRFSKKTESTIGKLTITPFLLKVIASALKVFPQFNASIDMDKSEVIYKKYYHVGVAVDTDRGLLVPVIKDIDKKSILEIAKELNEMAERARHKKTTLDEMQGAGFTLTNLGGIGGTFFTPIVNAPDVAILGVSRANFEPVYQNDDFVPRFMLPLSLSYDHRLIDGADGARFLRWVCDAIQQPFLMDLGG